MATEPQTKENKRPLRIWHRWR